MALTLGDPLNSSNGAIVQSSFGWDGRPLVVDRCVGGHVIDASDTQKPVEYLDGVIAGYCRTCQCRVQFRKVEGGLSALWLKVLATQILAGQFSADLWAEFIKATQAVAADREAIESALSLSDTVREIVSVRLRDV